jgi:hypothetical protein
MKLSRTKTSRLLVLVGMVALSLDCAFASADDKQQWGGVKGQIVLDAAAAPAPVPLQITKDQNVCLAKGPIESEDLIVNKGNLGVKNAFVWLIPDDVENPKPLAIHPKLKPIKNKEVVVDQPCCMFVPHVLGMREGQVLIAKNPSPIAHNFHWTGHPLKNPGGNSIIPAGGELKVEGLVADRVPVKMSCDIHPWMSGWIRVFDHPYFAVTDKDGKFEIKDAPAGPCRMVIWHESIGWVDPESDDSKLMKFGRKIDIPAGKSLDRGVIKMKQP